MKTKQKTKQITDEINNTTRQSQPGTLVNLRQRIITGLMRSLPKFKYITIISCFINVMLLKRCVLDILIFILDVHLTTEHVPKYL